METVLPFNIKSEKYICFLVSCFVCSEMLKNISIDEGYRQTDKLVCNLTADFELRRQVIKGMHLDIYSYLFIKKRFLFIVIENCFILA
jgi:hypothetical protein